MGYPKIKPCPQCGAEVELYEYESGWKYVECIAANCQYSGPGEVSKLAAIKSHNATVSSNDGGQK